jgi:hypothetical protein
MEDTLLFLLRVWHGPGAFRASLREVAEETVHLFDSPTELAGFVEQRRERANLPSEPSASPVRPPGTPGA